MKVSAMKKLFAFLALLLAPSSAQADISGGGWPRPPRPNPELTMSMAEREQAFFTGWLIGTYALWAVGLACFAWAGWLGWLGWKAMNALSAATGMAAAAYAALGLTFAALPFILIIPPFGCAASLSGIGLFWYFRRRAKAKAADITKNQ